MVSPTKVTTKKIPPKPLQEQVSFCLNKEIAQYMHQWFEAATLRNDRLQFVYRKALTSILQCPHRIINGKQLTALPGIGVNLRDRIENRIREDPIDDYEFALVTGGGVGVDVGGDNDPTTSTTTSTTTTTPSTTQPSQPKRKKRKTTKYIPQYRSGPYAVLISLFMERRPLSRRDISNVGQPYCHLQIDEAPSSQSSGASSWMTPLQGALKTLQDKALIERISGQPPCFRLTADGSSLARTLVETGEGLSGVRIGGFNGFNGGDGDGFNNNIDDNVDDVVDDEITTNNNINNTVERIQNSSLEVVLLIDVREKSRTGDERSFFVNKFIELGIRAEVRVLEVGDFMWIARPSDDPSIEIVLDCIVERKKESDLRSSIVDGRFKEQKYRLKLSQQSIVYLVEGEGVGVSTVAPTTTNGSAEFQRELMDVMIIDGFRVRHTGGISETIRFLRMMHHKMESELRGEGEFVLYGPWCAGGNATEYMKWVKDNPGVHCLLPPLSLRVSKSSNVKISDILFRQLSLIKGGMNCWKVSSIIEGLDGGLSNLGHLWRMAIRDGEGFLDKIQHSNDHQSHKPLAPSLKKRIFSLLTDRAPRYSDN